MDKFTQNYVNGCTDERNKLLISEMAWNEKNGHDASCTSNKDCQSLAEELGYNIEDLEFARQMDSRDPLKHLRDEFIFPKMKDLPDGKLIHSLTNQKGNKTTINKQTNKHKDKDKQINNYCTRWKQGDK